MQKDLFPTKVTYIHPVSAKQLTDAVLEIDYAKQTLRVDRCAPQSTAPLKITFSEVVCFEFPYCTLDFQ